VSVCAQYYQLTAIRCLNLIWLGLGSLALLAGESIFIVLIFYRFIVFGRNWTPRATRYRSDPGDSLATKSYQKS